VRDRRARAPFSQAPDVGRRVRLGLAAVVTLVVVGITVFGGSDTPASRAGGSTTTAPGSASGPSTTAAPPTTAVAQQIALNPAWVQKGSSRYSDSEESKQLHDQLGPLVSSTLPIPTTTVKGAKGATTTTVKGARTTTTQRGSTTTKAPVPTTPVTAAPPPPTDPVTTAPPETTAPAAATQSIVTPTP